MFRQTIALTPLTTDAANSYFSNITGDRWDNDNSFLATLRALVAPRIKEEDSIRLKFGRTNYDKSTVVGNNAREVVSAICRNYNLTDSNGLVVIHSFYNDHDSNMANFDVINSTFASTRDIIGLIRSKSFTKSLSVLNAISIQKRKMQFSLLTALTGRNFIIFRSLSSHSFRGTLSRKRGSLNLRWNSFILCARQLQRSMRLACSGLQSSTISELPVSVSC